MKRKKTSKNAQMAERALKDAFKKLVLERRKTGGTLILWQNGKVVEIPASKIPDSALNAKLIVR